MVSVAGGNAAPWRVVLRRITDTLLNAKSTRMEDSGREVFVYLFNHPWPKKSSHRVIFQLRLMLTYSIPNYLRIIMPFKPLYVLESIIFTFI